jgi:hypothetical protein
MLKNTVELRFVPRLGTLTAQKYFLPSPESDILGKNTFDLKYAILMKKLNY